MLLLQLLSSLSASSSSSLSLSWSSFSFSSSSIVPQAVDSAVAFGACNVAAAAVDAVVVVAVAVAALLGAPGISVGLGTIAATATGSFCFKATNEAAKLTCC